LRRENSRLRSVSHRKEEYGHDYSRVAILELADVVHCTDAQLLTRAPTWTKELNHRIPGMPKVGSSIDDVRIIYRPPRERLNDLERILAYKKQVEVCLRVLLGVIRFLVFWKVADYIDSRCQTRQTLSQSGCRTTQTPELPFDRSYDLIARSGQGERGRRLRRRKNH
jgi:hypothetical protein